jgi:hypothetical protein
MAPTTFALRIQKDLVDESLVVETGDVGKT